MSRHLPGRRGNTFPCGEQHFMSQLISSFTSFSVIPSCFLVIKTLPAQDHPIHLTSTCVRLCTFPSLFPLAGLYSWITGGHCPLIPLGSEHEKRFFKSWVLGLRRYLSWQHACHRSIKARVLICSTPEKSGRDGLKLEF